MQLSFFVAKTRKYEFPTFTELFLAIFAHLLLSRTPFNHATNGPSILEMGADTNFGMAIPYNVTTNDTIRAVPHMNCKIGLRLLCQHFLFVFLLKLPLLDKFYFRNFHTVISLCTNSQLGRAILAFSLFENSVLLLYTHFPWSLGTSTCNVLPRAIKEICNRRGRQ